MKKLFGILLALALVVTIPIHGAPKSVYKPKEGYVPDARTASRIAEAILIPIYGEEQIKSELPLAASLKGDIWTVTGSLPPGMAGGVAEVQISKKTGEILGVIHGK